MKLLFAFLLILFNRCSSIVVEFKEENQCPQLNEPILINTTPTFGEITICTKFSLKFLRSTGFMQLSSSISNMSLFEILLIDFSKNYGFVRFYGVFLMFEWPEHTMKPDIWQQMCATVSNSQIIVVLNGNVILNEISVSSNLTRKEDKQANFWLGGNNENGIHTPCGTSTVTPCNFVGSISRVYLWSQKLEISDMIHMTNSCKLINTTPDLFIWDSFQVSFI